MVYLLLSVGCARLDGQTLDSGRLANRTLDAGCAGSPYTTIQQALDDARPGDVIEVCPGTYPERLTVEGKALTLRSRAGAEQTVVDAQGKGSALSISAGAEVTVEGMTLRGGADPGNGGNLYCSFSTLWLEHSRLEAGAAVTGGGLGATSCEGHVVGNVFEGNQAWSGAGAWIYGDALVFEENTFVSNRSEGAAGALYLYGSSTVAGNRFEGNTATLYAGALYLDQSHGEVHRNTFVDNHAGDDGGAVYVFEGSPLLSSNRFVSNRAEHHGGALYASDSGLDLDHSVLRSNRAAEGGAVYLDGGETELRQLVLLNNSAPSGSVLASYGEARLYNSVLAWNDGGAVLSGEVWAQYNDLFRNEGELPDMSANLALPPGFTSLADGDYTLTPTSPLRDAGHPDELDADGTRSDIGLHGGI